MTPEKINKKLQIPDEDSSTPIKSTEAEFIYNFVKELKLTKTLETGFAYAKSASHIIAATQSKHIAIDPFQSHYQNLGIENIKNLGFSEYLEFYNDYSHNVLPKLVTKKEKFEFIFIDGDHKFDGEFVDFYYADLLLEEGGYVLFHDTWMRSTRLVMAFIKKNRKDYRYIKTIYRNFGLFQKISKDDRDGMYYKEFFTLKSIFSHNLILWMTTGKKTGLKKALFYLKEKIK